MSYLQKFFPFLVLLLLSIILFYKIIFLNQVFYYGDNFYLNTPLKSILVSSIKHGELPLWNPFLFIGLPYFADMNLGTLYPLNIIYFFFSIEFALSLLAVFDIFIIGFLTYIFLRTFRFSQLSCLFGGIIFAFCGETINYVSNIAVLNVIVFIPLLFFFLRKFLLTKRILYFNLLILFQSIQIVSGHPQITYYTALFITIFLLSAKGVRIRQKLVFLFYYLLFPILLASIQLIPFVEMVLNSNRFTPTFQFATSKSLGIPDLITFFFPTFYGSLTDGTWWGRQQILIGYIGVSALIFMVYGYLYSKEKEKVIIGACLLISIIIALGNNTPFYLPIYYVVPGIKYFRDPQKIIIFFSFFASILAAIGLESLKQIINKKKRIFKIKSLIILSTIFSFFCSITYFVMQPSKSWHTVIASLAGRLHFLERLLPYSVIKIHVIFQNALLNAIVFFFLIVITLLITVSKRLKFSTKQVLLLSLLAINLIFFDSKIILSDKQSLFTHENTLNSAISKEDKSMYRILSLPVNLHQDKYNMPGADFFKREAVENLLIYRGDNNISQNLYQVSGYSSTVLQKFQDFELDHTTIGGVNINLFFDKGINQASIKYILSDDEINVPNNWQKNKFGNISVFKNSLALPRAYAIDKKGKITDAYFGINKISVNIESTTKNQLVITDQYYPGWIAYVNNKETKINKYEKTFRMVEVPEGISHVEFVYSPKSFYVGAIISLFSLIIFSIYFFYSKALIVL